MTISGSFIEILNRCDFTPRDRTLLATHRSEVETRLKHAFDVSKIEAIGSDARGSAIRQSSDLDLLLVLRKSELVWGGSRMSSTTVLEKVRTQLTDRFPSTAIGRDRQAVVVAFSDDQSIDVVPAGWIRAQPDGWPLYIIPDGRGGWLETAPGSHGRYIAGADARSGGKLKNVARIYRYYRWSRKDPVPVSAFHVELLLAVTDVCRVGSSYPECFAVLLEQLRQRGCRALQDPLGVSGYVSACGTEAQRVSALKTISASAERATAAIAAERNGNAREARRLWSIVFNHRFPG